MEIQTLQGTKTLERIQTRDPPTAREVQTLQLSKRRDRGEIAGPGRHSSPLFDPTSDSITAELSRGLADSLGKRSGETTAQGMCERSEIVELSQSTTTPPAYELLIESLGQLRVLPQIAKDLDENGEQAGGQLVDDGPELIDIIGGENGAGGGDTTISAN